MPDQTQWVLLWLLKQKENTHRTPQSNDGFLLGRRDSPCIITNHLGPSAFYVGAITDASGDSTSLATV